MSIQTHTVNGIEINVKGVKAITKAEFIKIHPKLFKDPGAVYDEVKAVKLKK